MKKNSSSENSKGKKNLILRMPIDLHHRIIHLDSERIPKYLDLTTKIFLLLELAIKIETTKPMQKEIDTQETTKRKFVSTVEP